jgi:hypothetical protein
MEDIPLLFGNIIIEYLPSRIGRHAGWSKHISKRRTDWFSYITPFEIIRQWHAVNTSYIIIGDCRHQAKQKGVTVLFPSIELKSVQNVRYLQRSC